MTWKAFEVVLRLRSPMHIGCGRTGNVQRTRRYVPGRVIWGALTLRLTRDRATSDNPACQSGPYRHVGERINDSLAFTYFYPAVRNATGAVRPIWPWDKDFSNRLLGSYGSTALRYPAQCAEEGMLHEAEFIAPHTTDNAEPVFLLGYVFQKEDSLDWRQAFGRVQFGGERGYGWGRVEFEPGMAPNEVMSKSLFGGAATMEDLERSRPLLRVPASESLPGRLLAHTRFEGSGIDGSVEPLVGREWRSDAKRNRHAGQHVEYVDVCLEPGTLISKPEDFEIGPFGLWDHSRKGFNNGKRLERASEIRYPGFQRGVPLER